MKTTIALILTTLLLVAVSAAQNKTVYTKTTEKVCKSIESNADEGGSYEGECPGVGGYKLRLLEGDIRQTLNVVTPGKKTFELNFWGFYGGFSYVGETVEWRTKGGVPVAMIARFNVSDGGEKPKDISYLMISKISEAGSCVTDIVAPIAKQNEKARELADLAPTKPCKTTGNE